MRKPLLLPFGRSTFAGREDDTSPAQSAEKDEVDARRILRDLAARWFAADTLEYRSRAVLQHQGEMRVTLRTWARLRKPGRARIVWSGENVPEASRVRVCDNRTVYDRMRGDDQPTTRQRFVGRLTQYVSHPLDDASYLIEQFFSRAPFWPDPLWGGAGEADGDLRVRATRAVRQNKPVFRIVFARGASWRDTLTLDARSLAPLEIVRRGVHGGLAQELLRETVTDVRLGVPLPDALFAWTPADQAGAFPAL